MSSTRGLLPETTYPDGRTVNMEAVRHPGSVVLIPMPAHARIVLVRQYRYVVDQFLWELPAGTLEPNEEPEAAALRECHEKWVRLRTARSASPRSIRRQGSAMKR
jgi:ADP-ribose pyrophosphatase